MIRCRQGIQEVVVNLNAYHNRKKVDYKCRSKAGMFKNYYTQTVHDNKTAHRNGGFLCLYHPLLTVSIVYARWQETKIHQDGKQIVIINLYIPHRNEGTNAIFRLLVSDMAENGDFGDAIEALFQDLEDRVLYISEYPVIVGGD